MLGLLAVGIVGLGAYYALRDKKETGGNGTLAQYDTPSLPPDFQTIQAAYSPDDISEWVRVRTANGILWAVAPQYIAPVGIQEAATIAAQLGFELPTKELVDAIWKAADLKIEPRPANLKFYTQDEMNSKPVLEAQNAYVQSQIAGRDYKLMVGSNKDVIRTSDGKLALYGWQHLDGKPIQDVYTGHAGAWKDYSQGLRLVKKVPETTA